MAEGGQGEMISDKHRFIFVHINKTGGTSIEKVFEDSADKKNVQFKHEGASFYRKHFPGKFRNYFKFAFVRNPWDWMVSRYHWSRDHQKVLDCSFPEFLHRLKAGTQVSRANWLTMDTYLAPQFERLCVDGVMAMDFVGRFENLAADFDKVCSHLHMQATLPHVFKTKHADYTEYYDEETKAIVEELYATDIAAFGYQFGISSRQTAIASDSPDPWHVRRLLDAFRGSKAMFAGVSLGIFTALAAGPKSLPVLASELGVSADGLERLLDACVGIQLLGRDGQNYRNTPAATAYLSQSSPVRVTGYVQFCNDVTWKLWANLEDAVREGSQRWQQTFGWDGPDFSRLFPSPEAGKEYLVAMHSLGEQSSREVIATFDLSPYRTLVDLGGGTGHLAMAACQCYPALRAVVFDRPEAIEQARTIVAASSVADRIQLVTGDFFTCPLPAGDIYVLGHILHDLPEDKISQLLTSICQQLPARGAVLVAEKILNADGSGPPSAQLENLNALTCKTGRERKLAEYKALLKRAGFAEVLGWRTSSPVDTILALKR